MFYVLHRRHLIITRLFQPSTVSYRLPHADIYVNVYYRNNVELQDETYFINCKHFDLNFKLLVFQPWGIFMRQWTTWIFLSSTSKNNSVLHVVPVNSNKVTVWFKQMYDLLRNTVHQPKFLQFLVALMTQMQRITSPTIVGTG